MGNFMENIMGEILWENCMGKYYVKILYGKLWGEFVWENLYGKFYGYGENLYWKICMGKFVWENLYGKILCENIMGKYYVCKYGRSVWGADDDDSDITFLKENTEM